jgi:hypothetical protein
MLAGFPAGIAASCRQAAMDGVRRAMMTSMVSTIETGGHDLQRTTAPGTNGFAGGLLYSCRSAARHGGVAAVRCQTLHGRVWRWPAGVLACVVRRPTSRRVTAFQPFQAEIQAGRVFSSVQSRSTASRKAAPSRRKASRSLMRSRIARIQDCGRLSTNVTGKPQR